LRTEIVHDTAQHSDAPWRTAVSLYAKSALSRDLRWPRECVLASVSGFIFRLWRIGFVYRLILRRRSPAANPGRIVSRLLRNGAAVLAVTQARVPPEIVDRNGPSVGSESFVWLFGLAELLMAITLRPRAALIAFPLGFLAHFVITNRIQKRGRQAGNIASR
jgi:hypothetical protein